MITIFIMYSNDRKEQLDKTLHFLRKMKHYKACQKVLVVDGKTEATVPEFDVINVPRIKGQFSWANMWDAGVAVARNPIVWYLDSDRLLPSNYIELLLENVRDNSFVFTSRHFMVKRELTLELCELFLQDGFTNDDRFLGRLQFEPRFATPPVGPGKGVMSGNTAFTVDTYCKLGGVDSWYCGHGAYADTDFQMQAAIKGCTFVDLKVPELHYHHHKLDENKVELDKMSLWRLSLDNFIYYCLKWNIPLEHAIEQAFECNIMKPKKYVEDRAKTLSAS